MGTATLTHLDNAIQAFDDWTVTHAPNFSDEAVVESAQERIRQAGGVFFYACKQTRNIKDFVQEMEGELTDDEISACAQAVRVLADWDLTLTEKSDDSDEAKEAIKRVIDGGGTLALICDARMPLEAIRDRLKASDEA